MSGFDPAQKTGHGTPLSWPASKTNTAADGASNDITGGRGFIHDLLDVINPLQHLPVISTLYRNITGEHIGTLEKLAGDTLYGGLWEAISSAADTLFEAVTGKDIGDTVLSMLMGPKTDAAGKAAASSAQTPSQQSVAPGADVAALSNALAAKGVNDELAQRAIRAYRRSMVLPNAALVN